MVLAALVPVVQAAHAPAEASCAQSRRFLSNFAYSAGTLGFTSGSRWKTSSSALAVRGAQPRHYLVRAVDGCPGGGEGSLGAGSNGTPRTGRSCP